MLVPRGITRREFFCLPLTGNPGAGNNAMESGTPPR
jgi:hypothetical protein